jgi:hypothetical protein
MDRETCVDCGENHGGDYTCPAATLDATGHAEAAPGVAGLMTLVEAEEIVAAPPAWGGPVSAARVLAARDLIWASRGLSDRERCQGLDGACEKAATSAYTYRYYNLTKDADGAWDGTSELSSEGTLAMCDGCAGEPCNEHGVEEGRTVEVRRLAEAAPIVPPATTAQRQAVRLLVEMESSGATPQVNSGVMKRLEADGWLTYHKATRTVTLAQKARDWVASEHTAEVTTIVHGGVTLYGATCNCGWGHENPRMARRVPWTSAMLTTAEDAVAVALGHGEVSRPRYEAPSVPVLAVGDRVAVSGDYTSDGVALSGTVTGVEDGTIAVEHAEGCAPLGYAAHMLTVEGASLGERLAAEEAALVNEEGTCRDCQLTVIWAHGMWIGADGDEECSASRTGAHRVPMCECAGGAPCAHEVSKCDSQAVVFTDNGHPRYEGRMCQPCQDVLDAALPVLVEASQGPGYTINFGGLTAEDVAGLPTAREGAEVYAAGRPWSARGSKRKASSKINRKRRHLASA